MRAAELEVLRTASRVVGRTPDPAVDADDLLQTAALDLIRAGETRPSSALIYTVVQRRWVDEWRRSGRRVPQVSLEVPAENFPGVPGPDVFVLEWEELLEALRGLEPTDAALLLLQGCGWSGRESARLFGLSRGAVHKRISRARLDLDETPRTGSEEG